MTTALEGVRGIVTPRPHFIPGKDSVPIVQEAGWVPWPVWTGVENLFPTGIRSPDRPAHSQSLYWLRYPAHILCIICSIFMVYQTSELLLKMWASGVKFYNCSYLWNVYHKLHSSSGVHRASYLLEPPTYWVPGTCFLRVKQLGYEADHIVPSVGRVAQLV
jgi:hypothetical protein